MLTLLLYNVPKKGDFKYDFKTHLHFTAYNFIVIVIKSRKHCYSLKTFGIQMRKQEHLILLISYFTHLFI